jgi:RNA polymerase sigma-70 factor (ECF subfamily)
MKLSDEGLIKRVAQGDEVSFTRLVKQYQNRVLSTIYRYVQDASATQDLAQEVFIKVWQKAGTFKGKSSFSTWLYRIVVNHCLNYRVKRKRHRIEPLDESMPDHRSRVKERFEAVQTALQVRKAVDELAPRQRIALILFKFEGYTCREVAQIMEISFSAAQSLLFRAIDNLRKRLVPHREQRST